MTTAQKSKSMSVPIKINYKKEQQFLDNMIQTYDTF